MTLLSRFSYIIAIGFLAILISTTAYYLSLQSIRLDESQTIWVTTKPLLTMWRVIAQDVHVPLYFTLMHFWLQFFGNDVFVARLPSFIFYLLTLVTLFQLVKTSSNRTIALITLALFSLSPFIMWYSFEARMYTMFTFAASLNHYFFLKLFRSNGQLGKAGFFLSAVFGIYTHYFFCFLLITQALYVFYKALSAPVIDQSSNKLIQLIKQPTNLIKSYYSLWVLAFVMLLPWVIYVYMQGSASNSKPLIPPPNSFNIFQTFAYFLFGFQSQLTQGIIVAFWPLLIILLFFVFTIRSRHTTKQLDYFIWVSFLPIILVFVVSLYRPIFLARYLIFTIPTLFFLIALVLQSYSRKASLILTSVVFLVVFSFLIYQNVSTATPVKEDYRSVATYLNTQATPSDIILMSAPFTVYPVEYLYRGSTRIETIPEWDRFNQGGIPPFEQDKFAQQISDYQKLYRRMLVVLSYDQGYEQSIRDYLENNFQRMDYHQFSPGLEVRVYQLRYDIPQTTRQNGLSKL